MFNPPPFTTVKINGKTWLAQNLNYDVGDGCWFYDNDPKNGEKYGRLYTWDAAKKVCPPGWHLPTDEEWKALANYFGGYYDWPKRKAFGDPLKSYKQLIKGGKSGFDALLGGFRGIDSSFLSANSATIGPLQGVMRASPTTTTSVTLSFQSPFAVCTRKGSEVS